MEAIAKIDTLDTPAIGTDERVARSFCWYAARTQMNCERKVEQRFRQIAIETYLPTQEEIHQWSDRKKKVQRLVIPMVIFVKMNRKEAHKVHENTDHQFYGFISTDRAGRIPAEIPEKDIATLKYMLCVADNPVVFESKTVEVEDNVEIVRGALKGLKGNIQRMKNGTAYMVVDMGSLGLVKTEIELANCKKIIDSKESHS